MSEPLIKWIQPMPLDGTIIEGKVGKKNFFDILDRSDTGNKKVYLIDVFYDDTFTFNTLNQAQKEAEKRFKKFLADCGLQPIPSKGK